MNKKLVCLSLVLVMVCVSSMAFAAPSKTTADLTGVLGAADAWTVAPIPLTADATAQLAAITAFMADKKGAVIDYFGDEIKAWATAFLPAGFDLSTLVMNELISIHVTGKMSENGDVAKLFQFGTVYKQGTQLFVLVGLQDGKNVKWMPLKAEATAEGWVNIFFTQQVLEMAAEKDVTLVVLSEDTSAK